MLNCVNSPELLPLFDDSDDKEKKNKNEKIKMIYTKK